MEYRHQIISNFPRKLTKQVINTLIAESAYFKGERRGFSKGHEDEDWLASEKEIKGCIAGYYDFLHGY
ncbi:MAG: DUF2934 domain-containing protein [Gammaproteobacteria bacterium]